MRVAFYTLGCKVNQYETQLLKEQFSQKGYEICEPNEIADVYLVNSCTVTQMANKKSRQAIHKFKRENPNAVVALMGCFPQAFKDKACLINEADIIIGTKNKNNVLNYVEKFLQDNKKVIDVIPHKNGEKFENGAFVSHEDKTRAFVKIEDGCERYCAYCIIPKARGKVRSKPIDEIAAEVSALVKNGYKEIVLVGINLAMYGVDFNLRLIDAVKAVCEIKGVERVRLGSSEPMLVTAEDFLEMSKYKNICPHFHIALQSGSDEVLKNMNRPYTTEQYSEIIKTVRENFDNPAITTDIIVGFPGETDKQFNETIEFVKNINLSMVHIFPYSRREGTKAYDMPNQVSEFKKTQRAKALNDVCEKLKKDFLNNQVGVKTKVLFENTTNQYGRMGHTPNYTQVYVCDNSIKRGDIKDVVITQVIDDFCIGKLL